MKNAYVLVSDTHFTDKRKSNRFNYQFETNLVKNEIDRLGIKYIERGINPILIFLGDIYDNSYKSPTASMMEHDDMVSRKKIFKDIFSVLGNHDLNFSKDNPFWVLTSEDSVKVTNLPRVKFKPLGEVGIIKVVDRLVDGDVVFNFNHYSSPILQPLDGKVNIGLFHQDIVCSPAITGAVNRGLNPYQSQAILLDKEDVLLGYDYSFFGHFHKYYGKWEINGGRLIYYLGSLGRPNHEEVANNFLERNLPAIIVEDGKFVGVEDNIITLLNRESSVNEPKVLEQQEKRRKAKEKKELISMDVCTGSVMDSVKSTLAHPIYDLIIDSILEGKFDDYYLTLKGGID